MPVSPSDPDRSLAGSSMIHAERGDSVRVPEEPRVGIRATLPRGRRSVQETPADEDASVWGSKLPTSAVRPNRLAGF